MAQNCSLQELQARYDDDDPAHSSSGGDLGTALSSAGKAVRATGSQERCGNGAHAAGGHKQQTEPAGAAATTPMPLDIERPTGDSDDDSDSPSSACSELELQDYLELHDDERHGGLTALGKISLGARGPNQQMQRGAQQARNSSQKLNANAHACSRGRNPDNVMDSLDDGDFQMSNKVATAYKVGATRQLGVPGRTSDKSDRATVEQALDPRTRMVLFKMLNRGVFSEINGCISTGKEANVYHAATPNGASMAIKVYKTSILVFKDREKYVKGDSRFRKGYSKGNPRKMVKLWAEKEMRNLMRLTAAGIRCPKAHMLQMHVLVMSFIGSDDVAAPRLKDATLPAARLRGAYSEMLIILRTLYHKCRLVHGDLSEYNILVHEGELYIIDVSQSVELDHPLALDFLREDISHVNAFFRRSGVATLTMRELFDFVVDPSINDSNINAALDQLRVIAGSRPLERTAEDEAQEAVFRQAFIPQHLGAVDDHEADFDRLAAGSGKAEGIYYQGIAGMAPDMTAVRDAPMLEDTTTAVGQIGHPDHLEQSLNEEEQDSPDNSSGSSSDHSSQAGDYLPVGAKPRSREQRKAHKAAVKEANRERRKTKTPKHVKKQGKKNPQKQRKKQQAGKDEQI